MYKTRSRFSSLLLGIVTTVTILLVARQIYGNIFFEPILAGIISGAITSWLAGTYYSGNPALAYAFSLLLLQTIVTFLLPQPPLDPIFHSILILSTMIGMVVCICACWAVDVYINFPRLYPDPKDRPIKHITFQTYLTKIFPGTLVLILGVALTSILLKTLLANDLNAIFAVVMALFLFAVCSWIALFKVQLPGSLWIGFGPLMGILFLDLHIQIPISGYLQKVSLITNTVLPFYWLPASLITISLALNVIKKTKSK